MIIQPVILSGGSGTRLWPLSREHYPKQLLAPFGEYTLLQATVKRLEGLQDRAKGALQNKFDITDPIVICNEEHRFLVAEQLRKINIRPETLMLEPVGRNTAPALTLAAIQAARTKNDIVLLVMPADHIIQDMQSFHDAVLSGGALAKQGSLVTFGIVPTRPETGYGYIKVGEEMTSVGDPLPIPGHCIIEFVEKPDIDTAKGYVEVGNYLWNSGIFMVKAKVWLDKIGQFDQDIFTACQRAYIAGHVDGEFYRIDKASFEQCPSDSIDYAVMEKITHDSSEHAQSAVIPLDAGWSDVGAWSSLWDVVPQDAQGNITKGDVVTHDTRNSLLISEHRLLAGIGLEDIIAIETADAVMIVHKDHVQDVKQIVTRLKSEGRTEHQVHRRVHRPWGDYEGIDVGERYQVKRITVKPGAALSLQMHHHRAEHWVVVKGTAKVTRGDEEFLLSENESTYIPIGVKHRLENPGTLPLEIIEVQSGSYLGEDDIVRFEDAYGRLKK